MIGNDIVDLRDSEVLPGVGHPGFDGRVFTDAERALIAAAEDAARMRWSLWAAKEAAFKALARMSPGRIFSPRRLQVALRSDGEAVVSAEEGSVSIVLRTQPDGQWVHALATFGAPAAVVAHVAELSAHPGDADHPSRAVRALAVREFTRERSASDGEEHGTAARDAGAVGAGSSTTGRGSVEGAGIVIARSVDGLPIFRIPGRPDGIALSLSHHGRFVAAAWLAEEALEPSSCAGLRAQPCRGSREASASAFLGAPA